MNSEKPSKVSDNKPQLVPYDSSCFSFIEAELDSPEMLFQTAATTVPYPVEQDSFERYIFQNQCAPYVLRRGDTIIAYGDIIHEPNKELRLCRLIVGRNFRGMGYGKALVNALVKKAKDTDPSLPIFLFVILTNTSAKMCYSVCGFKSTDLIIDLKDGNQYHPTIQMKYYGD